MNIPSGFYYHIKDTFFEEVQDSSLMANKEDGNYRPITLPFRIPTIPEFTGWCL